MKRHTQRPKRIFNKLLLTSSITIIATVTILFIMISNYYADVIIQREKDLNIRILERVDDYFTEKEADVTNMIRALYANNDLIDDLSYALQNGYEDYLKYRLDRYTQSSSFSPTDINVFFKSYFSQYDDVNTLSLHSIGSPQMEYLYIYNNNRWNNSIISEYKPSIVGLDQNNPVYDMRIKRELQDTITIKRNINDPVTRNILGTLSIYYTTDRLNRIVNKTEKEVNSITFLLNQSGELLYASDSDVSTEIIEALPEITNDEIVKWDGETYYVNSMIGSNEYTYIGIIPKKQLNNVTFVKGTMWILIGLSTLMAIFITYSFMRNYSSRIDHINASIREVEKGNLDIRIRKFKQKDELTTISESFNAMLDELNDYIDRFYVVNIKQQQAELKALQSQINPHFLFNTLEVIRMVAVIEGSQTSSQMVFHLSQIFRYTLESKEMVPLHIELEHTKQYLQLIQLHHPNKLEVVVNIPSELENIPIQKLVLQPIIENYIVHGFKKDTTDNKLEIQAVQMDDHINICVKDNGLGISEQRMQKILDHLEYEDDIIQSIGLKNVHQRLKLKYGEEFGLRLQSKEGIETIIAFSIPIGG